MGTYKVSMSVLFLIICLSGIHGSMFAQSGELMEVGIFSLPSNFLSRLDVKVNKIEKKVVRSSARSLIKMQRQEVKLKRQLMKKDSAAASNLFGNNHEQYSELISKLRSGERIHLEGKVYDAQLDKLRTGLAYYYSKIKEKKPDDARRILKSSLQLETLDNRFDYTAQINAFLKQRQHLIKTQLQKYGIAQSLIRYNKQAYYYMEQIKEYRAVLSDPGVLEQKVLTSLQQLPAFQSFMQKYSLFAAMFPLPSANSQGAAGIQTRDLVEQLIQERIGNISTSPDQFLQQQLQQTQSTVAGIQDQLIKRISESGSPNNLNFRPNDQKVKSLRNRIEIGTNLQSIKSSRFFPSTADLGISLGYKLNSRSIVGIGASYKIGLGKNINNIHFTHEGIGIRSFADWKLKGSFFLSGGYEQNYRSRFKGIDQLKGISDWQQSGLMGISKIISLKTKLLKKTKAQLLWNFLSYSAIPREQPIRFRLGYTF